MHARSQRLLRTQSSIYIQYIYIHKSQPFLKRLYIYVYIYIYIYIYKLRVYARLALMVNGNLQIVIGHLISIQHVNYHIPRVFPS